MSTIIVCDHCLGFHDASECPTPPTPAFVAIGAPCSCCGHALSVRERAPGYVSLCQRCADGFAQYGCE